MDSPLIKAWRLLQYPVALVVAALVSVVAALIFVAGNVPVFLMHGIVGFLGVFVGGLLFIPRSRRTGAIFLALIGISFFYVRFVWNDVGPASVPDAWLRLGFISGGAAIAVGTHTAWLLFSPRST